MAFFIGVSPLGRIGESADPSEHSQPTHLLLDITQLVIHGVWRLSQSG